MQFKIQNIVASQSEFSTQIKVHNRNQNMTSLANYQTDNNNVLSVGNTGYSVPKCLKFYPLSM
jgi:hypothetical protein